MESGRKHVKFLSPVQSDASVMSTCQVIDVDENFMKVSATRDNNGGNSPGEYFSSTSKFGTTNYSKISLRCFRLIRQFAVANSI